MHPPVLQMLTFSSSTYSFISHMSTDLDEAEERQVEFYAGDLGTTSTNSLPKGKYLGPF